MTDAARRIIFLVGFDRSGTSYISGLLEHHPQVQYYCQPDNGSPLHKAQWEYWNTDDGDAASRRFFQTLERGRIDRSFVNNPWFRRTGCGRFELDPQSVNVIKSTKLHLKIRWIRQFSQVEVLGVIRDPRSVVASLVKNDFHTRWYTERDFQAAQRLASSGKLPDVGINLTPPRSPSAIGMMSYLVLLRTAIMCHDLGWQPEALVRYEASVHSPTEHLCSRLNLEPCELEMFRERDYNLVGEPFRGTYHRWYTLRSGVRSEVQTLLEPLCVRLGYPATLQNQQTRQAS